MENMKNQRVAIYYRIGNPDDDDREQAMQENPLPRYMAAKGGGAAILPLSSGEIQKFFAHAGQKAMDEVLSGRFSGRTQINKAVFSQNIKKPVVNDMPQAFLQSFSI